MAKFSYVVFWLRAISCLSIVMIHSITTTFYKFDIMDHPFRLRVFQLLLMFSTPTFVFISEFLLAKRQGISLKKGFFKNKLLYLGLPYIIVNFGLAFIYSKPGDVHSYLETLFQMMFRGGTVTYFIVIIIQFYILHYLFAKYLIRFNPFIIILLSLAISSGYWALRDFMIPLDLPVLHMIWEREGWMIFVGWLIYFSLGFYIGNYYEAFISNIKKFTIPIILLFTFATIFMIYNYYSGAISIVESKRADIPFYCTSIILLFFLVSSYINYLPKFILFISNYSFSIYLTHYFFVHRLGQLSDSPETNIIFTFILTVTLSLLTAQIFNAFRWGKFIVGGVGKLKYEEVVGRNY